MAKYPWTTAQVRCWPCGDQFDGTPIAEALAASWAKVSAEGAEPVLYDEDQQRLILGPGGSSVTIATKDGTVLHECHIGSA